MFSKLFCVGVVPGGILKRRHEMAQLQIDTEGPFWKIVAAASHAADYCQQDTVATAGLSRNSHLSLKIPDEKEGTPTG